MILKLMKWQLKDYNYKFTSLLFMSGVRAYFVTPTTNDLDFLKFTKPIYSGSNVPQFEDVLGGGYGGNIGPIGKLTYDGQPSNYAALDMQRDPITNICYLQNNITNIVVLNYAGRYGLNSTVASFNCSFTNPEHNNLYWNGEFDANNGAYSPGNDALFYASIIKQMYLDWYGIPPVVDAEGKDAKILMYVNVHADNAFYDGDIISPKFYFGNGRPCTGSECYLIHYPLISLEVVAHELSHAFTLQHGDLPYSGNEGSAIAESFGDMNSVAAEYYFYGENVWSIGAEISRNDTADRYMDDPTRNGRGIDNYKNLTQWTPVHVAAGIFNKAFYLIATSGNWTTKKAFDVMVKANMKYWSNTTDFHSGACGVVNATQDYGFEVAAVKSAMQAVGIDMDCTPKASLSSSSSSASISSSKGNTVSSSSSIQLSISSSISSSKTISSSVQPLPTSAVIATSSSTALLSSLLATSSNSNSSTGSIKPASSTADHQSAANDEWSAAKIVMLTAAGSVVTAGTLFYIVNRYCHNKKAELLLEDVVLNEVSLR
jgi:hypothetical protein